MKVCCSFPCCHWHRKRKRRKKSEEEKKKVKFWRLQNILAPNGFWKKSAHAQVLTWMGEKGSLCCSLDVFTYYSTVSDSLDTGPPLRIIQSLWTLFGNLKHENLQWCVESSLLPHEFVPSLYKWNTWFAERSPLPHEFMLNSHYWNKAHSKGFWVWVDWSSICCSCCCTCPVCGWTVTFIMHVVYLPVFCGLIFGNVIWRWNTDGYKDWTLLVRQLVYVNCWMQILC